MRTEYSFYFEIGQAFLLKVYLKSFSKCVGLLFFSEELHILLTENQLSPIFKYQPLHKKPLLYWSGLFLSGLYQNQ